VSGTKRLKPKCDMLHSISAFKLNLRRYTKGKKARVVSMPCWELFEEQSAEYKESVFPAACKAVVSIEAASTFGWAKYAQKSIGRDDFGASAPAGILYKEFGITSEAGAYTPPLFSST